MNSQIDETPKSEVSGVSWCSNRNKWQVHFYHNANVMYLGLFEKEDDAIAVRKDAEEKYGVPQVGGRRRWKYLTEADRKSGLAANNLAYRIKHKERLKQKHRDSNKRRKLKDPIGFLLMDSRKRAKQRGLDFDLSPSTLTLPERCEICGVTLQLFTGKKFKSDAASIDRIDNSKGYIDGNVKFICLDCNRWKSDCTESWRFRAIADYMDRYLSSKH